MQSCIRQLRYSAVTLALKNNSFHLPLKHSLQATFMITEWRQTSNLILESLPSYYQPKTKDGDTPEVVSINRLVAYLVVL